MDIDNNLEYLELLGNATAKITGTTLITLYIPSGSNIWLVNDEIKKEICSAINIKCKNVRTNVIKNLKLIQEKLPKYVPENGLVVLAGNINEYI